MCGHSTLLSPETNGPETVLLGFWKRFAQHTVDRTVEYKRANLLFVIMNLTNNILSMLQIRPYTSDADTRAACILGYLVHLVYMKRFNFLFDFRMPAEATNFRTVPARYWVPFTPVGNLTSDTIRVVQEILWFGQRHAPNPEPFGEQNYLSVREYDLQFHMVLRDLLKLFPRFTHIPLKDLAFCKMVCMDNSVEDFSELVGWDFLGIDYFL